MLFSLTRWSGMEPIPCCHYLRCMHAQYDRSEVEVIIKYEQFIFTLQNTFVFIIKKVLSFCAALQDLLLSKDALAQEAIVLQDKLTAAQHDNAVITETLARTQIELHKRARA